MNKISFSIQLPSADADSLKSILKERLDQPVGIKVQHNSVKDTQVSFNNSNSLKSEISISTITVTIGAMTALVTAIGSILKEWLNQRRTKIKITNSQSGLSIEYEGQLSPSFEHKIDKFLLANSVSGEKSEIEEYPDDRNGNE